MAEQAGWAERLRADARAIFAAGVAAVEPRGLVREHLRKHAGGLTGRVRIAAVGKAAIAMANGALEMLGERIESGVIIAPPGPAARRSGGPADADGAVGVSEAVAPATLAVFEGGHPIPNEAGVAGARAILDMARGMGAEDSLLCLISGGGSALMTLPLGALSLGDVQASTDLLLRAGATIGDLNCFRKHVDRLKGGRLAAAAAPARVVALVLSDVVGDPLDVIASGPVSPDPTTFADARAVLERFEVYERVPAAVRAHLEAGLAGELEESPKAGDACFDRVETTVVGSNRMAAEAALEAARARGYDARVATTGLTGEARVVGADLAAAGTAIARGERDLAPPACVISAGETTVTVRGTGRGGRNQELALGAAVALAGTERVLVASMGTDGVDGPTDAAGAWADGRSRARAEALGIDLDERLAMNDSHRVFAALDDLIVTGPTGTNVMDLMLVLAIS